MRWCYFWFLGLIMGAGVFTFKWVRRIRNHAYDNAQNEASDEKVRFLQRLDHELKNPLTAMQIALANLSEETDTNKQHPIHISMRGQLLRMSRLINDLRKLASLEKDMLDHVLIDTAEMLTEIEYIFRDDVTLLERHFSTKNINSQLPTITGDRDLLQLAIFNMLDNARKFTYAHDKITLMVTYDDTWLTIEIEDTGRGIPQSDLAHVWEDLYRSPDVQGIEGSGVGLALVKRIIEQHAGEVAITSTYGSGTTVCLQLPLA